MALVLDSDQRERKRGSEGGEEVESERSTGQRHVKGKNGEGWRKKKARSCGRRWRKREERRVGEIEMVQSEVTD